MNKSCSVSPRADPLEVTDCEGYSVLLGIAGPPTWDVLCAWYALMPPSDDGAHWIIVEEDARTEGRGILAAIVRISCGAAYESRRGRLCAGEGILGAAG